MGKRDGQVISVTTCSTISRRISASGDIPVVEEIVEPRERILDFALFDFGFRSFLLVLVDARRRHGLEIGAPLVA